MLPDRTEEPHATAAPPRAPVVMHYLRQSYPSIRLMLSIDRIATAKIHNIRSSEKYSDPFPASFLKYAA